MAVTEAQQVCGSVSGGCVEGEIIENAAEVLSTGRPKLLGYTVSDEKAWTVGLTCGGRISVLVEKHPAFSVSKSEDRIWQTYHRCLKNNQPAVLVKKISEKQIENLLVFPDKTVTGSFGKDTDAIVVQALACHDKIGNQLLEISGSKYYFDVFRGKPQLLLVGASHISVSLIKLAKELQFTVGVIEPRAIFADETRFPVKPDLMFMDWPDKVLKNIKLNETTFAVLLTHDPKIDDPALHVLLRSNVKYIGALGSKRTHAKRVERLKSAGFDKSSIARIKAPVGLDINAGNPAEIALSIMAEIVQIRNRY